MIRFDENPLLCAADIKPTREDFEIAAVLNPAVTTYNGETILLMRVAERPKQRPGFISVGVLDEDSDSYKVLHFDRTDPLLNATDPRVFTYEGVTFLTSISHLRIARSRDGRNFNVDPKPFIKAAGPDEEYGCEDARITLIDGTYYVYWVAVCRHGFSTMLATTRDFKMCQRKGIIFPAVNKDVAIFPEKIGNLYYALTRPDTGGFARPSMWIANSPDLVNWGNHQFLIATRKRLWDSGRIGTGTVPLRTDKGWLEIYHGADTAQRYCLGLLLLDADNPGRVLYRGKMPVLEPREDYERHGFFNDVVFTNGAVQKGDRLDIYYGAADQCICAATGSISELLKRCEC